MARRQTRRQLRIPLAEASPTRDSMKRGRLGFTLIELLVVIGIIAVLIAILIPVVGRVRLAAQTANTTNQMHRISAAIQNYFNDFQAYPGVFSNREFTP